MKHGSLLLLGLSTIASMFHAHASTHYQGHFPNQKMPYCENIPFDFVDRHVPQTQIDNRIFVNQAVQLKIRRNDRHPLTGLVIWSPRGMVKAKKLASDHERIYSLPALEKGKIYQIRGTLKYPATGLNICVSPF